MTVDRGRIILGFILAVMFVILGASPGDCSPGREQIQEFLNKGDELIRSGDYQEALEQYQKGYDLDSGDPDSNYKMGVACYFLKRYEDAIGYYKKAIEKKPDHFRAMNNLGMIYQIQDENARSARYFDMAIKANPNYKLARYNLGVAFYKQDKMEEARKVAQELVELFSEYDKGYYLLGLIEEYRDHLYGAEEQYLKALQYNSRNTDASEGIKRIHARQQMSIAQKEALKKAKNVVGFHLPPDYEFEGMTQQESGAKVIHVTYRKEQDIFLVRFPDTHFLRGKNLEDITGKPQKEFDDFLMAMNITQLDMMGVEKFDSFEPVKSLSGDDDELLLPVEEEPELLEDENPSGDRISTLAQDNASEELAFDDGQNSIAQREKYARIRCRRDGSDYRGIISLVPLSPSEGAVLFMSLAPGDSFTLSVAKKFLVNMTVDKTQ